MAKSKYKVGDKVLVRLFGGQKVTGSITNIKFDDMKQDMVADLDCGHWCYLTQIVSKL